MGRFTECVGASLETLLERQERIFRDAHPTEEAYEAFLQGKLLAALDRRYRVKVKSRVREALGMTGATA